ncbi:hypothetical protein V1477_005012 [Vespula maculifrons]|uniref:Uncharacterized protein n=1 Tax=Vespula maculifrons TaxID=7453 RepID=A0ABD2CNF5_VESMC
MDSSDDSIPVNRSPHRRSTASVRDESSQGKGVGDRKGEEHRAVVVMLMVVVLVVVFVAFVVVVSAIPRWSYKRCTWHMNHGTFVPASELRFPRVTPQQRVWRHRENLGM